jgi:hypothetical protein
LHGPQAPITKTSRPWLHMLDALVAKNHVKAALINRAG